MERASFRLKEASLIRLMYLFETDPFTKDSSVNFFSIVNDLQKYLRMKRWKIYGIQYQVLLLRCYTQSLVSFLIHYSCGNIVKPSRKKIDSIRSSLVFIKRENDFVINHEVIFLVNFLEEIVQRFSKEDFYQQWKIYGFYFINNYYFSQNGKKRFVDVTLEGVFNSLYSFDKKILFKQSWFDRAVVYRKYCQLHINDNKEMRFLAQLIQKK